MSKISKLENVTLIYTNGRIEVKGKTINAALVVSQGDLKTMYFGGTGRGTLNVTIETPDATEVKK